MNENMLVFIVLIFGAYGALGRVRLSSYKPNDDPYTLGSVIVGSMVASVVWAFSTMLVGKTIYVPILDVDVVIILTMPIAIAIGGSMGFFSDIILVQVHGWIERHSGLANYKNKGVDRRIKNTGKKRK